MSTPDPVDVMEETAATREAIASAVRRHAQRNGEITRSPTEIRSVARTLTVVGVDSVLAASSLHVKEMASRWRVELRTGVGVRGLETKTAVVIPFFLGVRRYVATPDPESGTRLFGSVEVGTVPGYQSATRVGSVVGTESITRTALRGSAGVGVDLRLGSRVTLGIVGGYVLMTDFSDPVGGQENHSGADFGLTLGSFFRGQEERRSSADEDELLLWLTQELGPGGRHQDHLLDGHHSLTSITTPWTPGFRAYRASSMAATIVV